MNKIVVIYFWTLWKWLCHFLLFLDFPHVTSSHSNRFNRFQRIFPFFTLKKGIQSENTVSHNFLLCMCKISRLVHKGLCELAISEHGKKEYIQIPSSSCSSVSVHISEHSSKDSGERNEYLTLSLCSPPLWNVNLCYLYKGDKLYKGDNLYEGDNLYKGGRESNYFGG